MEDMDVWTWSMTMTWMRSTPKTIPRATTTIRWRATSPLMGRTRTWSSTTRTMQCSSGAQVPASRMSSTMEAAMPTEDGSSITKTTKRMTSRHTTRAREAERSRMSEIFLLNIMAKANQQSMTGAFLTARATERVAGRATSSRANTLTNAANFTETAARTKPRTARRTQTPTSPGPRRKGRANTAMWEEEPHLSLRHRGRVGRPRAQEPVGPSACFPVGLRTMRGCGNGMMTNIVKLFIILRVPLDLVKRFRTAEAVHLAEDQCTTRAYSRCIT
mmetsp:Transcript_26874/g.67667  ORF Transcript_26874/g.67667 Transcript_26874/m.67667 type:complete len:274 (-) Transcript_26874:693-1514(-)